MLLVGLTGGLASGKSFVGKELERLGCHLIQADEIGHQVLLPDGPAYQPVVDAFGPEILAGDGQIDRRKLAGIVFGDAEKLRLLNSFVHPAVVRREQEAVAAITAIEPDAIIVIEAAILVETGSYQKFHRLIVVFCTPEQQVERAMQRDAYTREEALARMNRQLPLSEKAKLADYVIDSSFEKEHTLAQTEAVYQALRSVPQ